LRFDRFKRLIGKENLASLFHKTVAIFGLGGVGSYVVEGIARSGVGKIIICDFDTIELTNINRQLFALDSTVGMYKTEIAEKRILDINPLATVLAFPVKADSTLILDILAMEPDFVVDAIDDVNAKIDLIKAAIHQDIPLISSMGFANKLHPELIRISTLLKTDVDPLAKVMRKRLRDQAVSFNFPVVYSVEKPKKIVDNEILASSAYCPSVAGLMIASYVINRMIGETQ